MGHAYCRTVFFRNVGLDNELSEIELDLARLVGCAAEGESFGFDILANYVIGVRITLVEGNVAARLCFDEFARRGHDCYLGSGVRRNSEVYLLEVLDNETLFEGFLVVGAEDVDVFCRRKLRIRRQFGEVVFLP